MIPTIQKYEGNVKWARCNLNVLQLDLYQINIKEKWEKDKILYKEAIYLHLPLYSVVLG